MKTTFTFFQVRCIIHVENWTKWLLGHPVYYFKYGHFQRGKEGALWASAQAFYFLLKS